MIIGILILIVLVFLLIPLRSSTKSADVQNCEVKGQSGELAVEYTLKRNISGDFVVLKNIYVPYKGKTSEIDLLLIHEKGIFVFESKDYGGWIFGSADQLNWTQSFKNGSRHQFYNPVRQNLTHIRALSNYLGVSEEYFFSYIVFSGRCSLRKVPESTYKTVIVQLPDMIKWLKETFMYYPAIFTCDDINAISGCLQKLTNKSQEERNEHIFNVITKCPYCGSELVYRNGKYGPFWGCSSYPKCRYIRPCK
ncbi:MAG: NERD domain-containing protein [Muribaculaceae bacterium]|nr:NERD domain-containing protein [Muribaculaceae bacterium]